MKKLLLLFSIVFFTMQVNAAPKRVKVSNASDTTLKVCVYYSTSVDDIGQAVDEFKSLAKGTSYIYDYNFSNGRFIHTVVFLPNEDKIIVNTLQASSSDAKEITINITRPVAKPVDQPEVNRMRRLVEDEIGNFSKTYSKYVRVDADASLGLQEYLGAIAIVDTSQKDSRNAIKLLYTARQLNISENPPLSGRSFQESYKISKEFAGNAVVSIPSAFSSNINFSNGDLQEITLSCKAIGNVLLPTRPGVTPISILLDFNEKSGENIIGTITEILDTCETCILQQVQGILAHGGIAVNVKRFKKSAVIFTGNAASVVTAKGSYVYENGFDYFDIISPRVIAIGFTAVSLRTSFAQTMISRLIIKKAEIDRLINNQQLSLNSLQNQQKEITELIEKLEKLQ